MTPTPDGATELFIAATGHPRPITVPLRGIDRPDTGRRGLAALRAAGRRDTDRPGRLHDPLHDRQSVADKMGAARNWLTRPLRKIDNNRH